MKTTRRTLQAMKERGEPLVMLTCYDYCSAKLLDRAGIPLILVGDSLGMVVLGHDSTLPVTLDDMISHTRAVVRGVGNAMVVLDLPFASYSPDDLPGSVRNAARALRESGAQAVKLEGGRPMTPVVRALTTVGIPVMGHLGLTPQSVHQLGGYRVQGRAPEEAQRLLEDAAALEEAGVFAVVLESVPADRAAEITAKLRVPTIGIGAGPHCDGQVQVFHDLLGLYEDFTPKHAKRYAELGTEILAAVRRYAAEVKERAFPGPEHSFDAAAAAEATAPPQAQLEESSGSKPGAASTMGGKKKKRRASSQATAGTPPPAVKDGAGEKGGGAAPGRRAARQHRKKKK